MMASLILMGGIALFATILVIIDEIGRRQAAREHRAGSERS
jgi:hypothetical protein